MANSLYYGQNLKDVIVNAVRDTSTAFDSNGYSEEDPTDTDLIAAMNEQGACVVDKEGVAETLTAGTVQTATTLSAVHFINHTAATTLSIRKLDATGDIVFGPISIVASRSRIVVFPKQITGITGGAFVHVTAGGLVAGGPGILIP